MSNSEIWLNGVTSAGELEIHHENSNQQMFNKGLSASTKIMTLQAMKRFGYKKLVPEAVELLRAAGFTVNPLTLEVTKCS